jgi:threonine/homoserine/homoserine lactone efflux protein
MLDIICTAIVLWLIWGFTPGPVILLSFSEILKSPSQGFSKGLIYVTFAGLTEFLIWLFLISTSSRFQIPYIFFHRMAILGSLMLWYLAFQTYKIHKIEYKRQEHNIKATHIIILMLLNGPLWLFWLSVCLPVAFRLGKMLNYWEYLFVMIFEIAMMIWLTIILLWFRSFRNVFSDEKIVSRASLIISFILWCIAIKILYSEIIFFYPMIRDLL